MENNQTIKKPKNVWKIIAIVLIAIAVILAGTTTIFALQSSQRKSELNEVKNQTSQNDKEDENSSCTDSCDETPDIGSQLESLVKSGYLVVPEWGIKIKTPHLDNVSRTFTNNTETFFSDLTWGDDRPFNMLLSNVSFFGESCGEPYFTIARVTDITDTDKFVSKGVVILGDYGYFVRDSGGFCQGEQEVREREEIRKAILNSENYTAL